MKINTTQEEEQNEVEDITYKEVKPEKGFVTEEVDIETKNSKAEENTKQSINFLDNNFTSDIFKNKKNISNSEGEEEEINTDKGQSQPQQQQPYKQDIGQSDIAPDDLHDIAEFIMDALDLGVSQLSAAIAKEKDTLQYELPRDKKLRLSRQLQKILVKYNLKMSIELLFLVGLGLAYKTPILSAVKTRKKKNADEKDKTRKDIELKRLKDITTKEGIVQPTIHEEKPILDTDINDNQTGTSAQSINRSQRGRPARRQ